MTKELKVYGWNSINNLNPRNLNNSSQVRVIVAAHSVAEALRLTGCARSEYNWSGSETWNDHEVFLATKYPLRALMTGVRSGLPQQQEWRDWNTGELVWPEA